ncbi:MAG TPA: bifunctional riboflavin kinase/FAD synthetase [Caulobacteraceae bacterium]
MTLRTVQGWRGLPPTDRGAAVAMGAFDGVHRGHRAVIEAAAAGARRLGAQLGVVSFEPHPRRFFTPAAPPFRLTGPAQRDRRLDAAGVDLLYLLPFDAGLARMPAESFAREVLAQGLGVRHVAVGFDFTYGQGRHGDAAQLCREGERLGFDITVVQPVEGEAGAKLSSTAARAALAEGDPRHAARVLGRPFAIEGVVRKGRGLGRPLGFPTANLQLGDYARPRPGIYAAYARLPDGRRLPAVAYLGSAETIGPADERLEVWIFDFDEDLYGRTIEVELMDFLRPDAKFDSLDAMAAQVRVDAQRAREVLAQPNC